MKSRYAVDEQILTVFTDGEPVNAQVDLTFVSISAEKIDNLGLAKLDQAQKDLWRVDLTKLRSSAYQKLKLLNS